MNERVPVVATQQQQVVLYDRELEPESTAYHFHAVLEFPVAPSLDELQFELDRLVDRYPILTASFTERGGQWQMTPGRAEDPRVRVVRTEEPKGSPHLAIETGANSRFRLGTEALVRWTLACRSDGSAALVHTEHHLVHDGVSFSLLMASIGRSLVGEKETYATYAIEQGSDAVRDSRRRTADHMVRALPDGLATLRPLNPESENQASGYLRLPLPDAAAKGAREQARKAGVTTFAVLLECFTNAARSLWQPEAPFVVGVATANRALEYSETVGMFVSTVPIVMSAQPSDYSLQDTAQSILWALENSNFDIEHYVHASRRRGLGEAASFPSVAFSMHHQEQRAVTIGGVEGNVSVGLWNGSRKFALNVVVIEHARGGSYEAIFEYDPQFVNRDQLWALWTRFVRATMSSVRPTETAGGTHAAELRSGPAVALRDANEEITYDDLRRRVPSLRELVDSDSPERIGVFGRAGAAFFAAQYVTHHAGHTFVPLSVRTPRHQLEAMLDAAGCTRAIAIDVAEAQRILPPGVSIIPWDSIAPCADSRAAVSYPPAPDAYVLFTSGTTGAPKGVRVSGPSLGALAKWGSDVLDMDAGTVCSQVADVGFDAAIWETWPAFAAGATVVVLSQETKEDPLELLDAIVAESVEVAFLSTPIGEILLRTDWPSCSLRVLAVGGDRLHGFSNHHEFRVLNLYGPTEATVISTWTFVSPSGGLELPSIGRPVPYGYVRVVDDFGTSVDGDRAGELWVGGAGVARGYLELDLEEDSRFIADPFSACGERVYRTGDIVRQRAGGQLEFVGRRDRQVKISGARVEIGSVEADLLSLDVVRAVAIDVVADGRAQRLDVYVSSDQSQKAIMRAVRERLPHYLQGSRITVVREIPTDQRGKVDLNALRAAAKMSCESSAFETDYCRDGHGLLQTLTEFLDDTPLSGSWFDRGGTSLSAAQFVARARSDLGVRVRLRELLEANDVERHVATLVGEATGNVERVHDRGWERLLDEAVSLSPEDRMHLLIEIARTLEESISS